MRSMPASTELIESWNQKQQCQHIIPWLRVVPFDVGLLSRNCRCCCDVCGGAAHGNFSFNLCLCLGDSHWSNVAVSIHNTAYALLVVLMLLHWLCYVGWFTIHYVIFNLSFLSIGDSTVGSKVRLFARLAWTIILSTLILAYGIVTCAPMLTKTCIYIFHINR